MANELIYASPVTSYLQGQQISQQNQLVGQQMQANQLGLQQAQAQAQRENDFRNALGAYLQASNGPSGQSGNQLAAYSQGGPDALAQLYAADPERAMQVRTALAQQQAAQHALLIQQATETYHGANAVINSKSPAALARAIYPQAVQAWSAQTGKDPSELTDEDAKQEAALIRDQAAAVAGIQPQLKEVTPGASLVDMNNPGAPVYTAPSVLTADQKARIDIENKRLAEEHRHNRATEANATAQMGGDLTPEELDLAATSVMTDPGLMRQFASFGKAGQARRDQINQAVAQKLKDSGMTPADLGSLRARFKAQATSINKMVPQLNAIESFESTAKFNAQRLLDLIDKIDNTGIPLIEGYARRAKKATGDPDQAEFSSVLQQFQTEAARIINNPNLTGVLSDSARQELHDVISPNASAAQTKRVINRLLTEMDFRRNSIQNQINTAGGAMTSAAGGAAAAPSSNAAPSSQTAPVRVNSPQEAMKLPSGTIFKTPDGRTKVRP